MPTFTREMLLRTRREELQKRFDNLTKRIAALDTDIGRAQDIVTKQIREEDRGELQAERNQVAAEMEQIENELGPIQFSGSYPRPPSVPEEQHVESIVSDEPPAPMHRLPAQPPMQSATDSIAEEAASASPSNFPASRPRWLWPAIVGTAGLLALIITVYATNGSGGPVLTPFKTKTVAEIATMVSSPPVALSASAPAIVPIARPSLTGTLWAPQAALSDCQGASWKAYPLKCADLVTQYLDQGQIFFAAKDCSQAVTRYEMAISLQPAVVETPEAAMDIAKAYDCRGSNYNGQREPDLAIADLTRALELAPALESAYINLGIAYTNRNNSGDQERAIEALDSAIEIRSETHVEPNSYAYLRRCIARRLIGDYGLAIDDCTTSIELTEDYQASHYERGLAYSLRHDYEQAIKDFTRAIELDPQHIVSYYQRGHAYKEQGQLDNAIADFEKVVALAKESEDMSALSSAAEKELLKLRGQ